MAQPVGSAIATALRAERERNARGLLDPIPNGLQVIPAPLGLTPTHAVGLLTGTDGVSQWPTTSGTAWARSNSVFRYGGATPITAGVSFPDDRVYKPSSVSLTFYVEWSFDGQVMEISTKPSAGRHRLYVDGVPATATAVQAGLADGNVYLSTYDLGSRANRQLRLQLGSPAYFGGVRTDVRDTIWRPETPPGPKVIVLGDSFTEGTGASLVDGFVHWLGIFRDWRDIWASGSGGTGILNPNSGAGRVKFRDRVQADVIVHQPDIVIVAGGINDVNPSLYPPASIQTEAALLFDAILTGIPGVTLIVVGPWWPKGTPTADALNVRDALAAAFDGRGHCFIDPFGGPYPYSGDTTNYTGKGYITGSGRIGSTNGTGNSDYYIGAGADTTHPDSSGHQYLARRLSAALTAWTEAGARKGAYVSQGVVSYPFA